MESTRRIALLYVLRDGRPVRHDMPFASWELVCTSDGERWLVRAPGRWSPPGDAYEADPAFVDAWLASAIAPFGTQMEPGIYRVDGLALLLGFEASIEPHRSSVDPRAPEDERRAAELRDADRLVELLPDDAPLRLARANLAAARARGAGFVNAEIARALASRRDAHTLLAASYVHAGAEDRESARALLHEALELDPTHDGAGSLLAALFRIDQRADDELALDERLAAHRPRSVYAWQRRAALLEGAGRLAEAVEAYDHALALEPDRLGRVRHRAHRGRLLAELGRDAEALEDLESSLPSYTYFPGYLAKAEVLFRAGRSDEAERTLRWVALSPEHREVARATLRRLGFADEEA